MVGVIEVYFDVNDYKVPAQNVWTRICLSVNVIESDTYSNILIESSINTNEMSSRVNEKRIYAFDITFGINETIFSGNEQQKVYYTDLKLFIFSFTLGHWYSLFPFSVRRIEKRKNVRDDVTVVLVAQGFTSLFLDQCSFHQVGNSFSEDVFPFKNCLFNFYWMENLNR